MGFVCVFVEVCVCVFVGGCRDDLNINIFSFLAILQKGDNAGCSGDT